MKKMNKKLHQWAQENNCHVWKLRKKLFWQNTNEKNATYKMSDDFMVTFNGLMILNKTSFEVFSIYLNATVLVTTQGTINKEEYQGSWQMYRH